MAKIMVVGDAIAVKSDIKLEDLKLVKKYRPHALKLMGGEDNKETIFKVDVAERGAGSINTYGASFAKASDDDEKLAIITMIVPEGNKAEEYASDQIGVGILHLIEIEEILSDVLQEIKDEQQRVCDCIEIVG